MKSTTKGCQLQIRVSKAQKSAIRRATARAGLGRSEYVLSQILSIPAERFRDHMREWSTGKSPAFVLAALHDLLEGLTASEMREAIEAPPGVSGVLMLRHIPTSNRMNTRLGRT